MDIETMPNTMYFSGNKETITKINQVPYQVIDYDDKGMFQAKLMDNTQVEIFIDNGATPSILPLNVYNKYPILQKCPKMESHTPIHTGGGMIESHFWIEIPLRLDNQIIQIKTLVYDSECPSFVPCHMIIGKGIACVKPLDQILPLRSVEIEFENNRCCLEVCNTSDCTIEF